MSLKSMQHTGPISNANFPMDAEGRTYHVGLKAGELANMVLMVGDHSRATLLKSLLSTAEDSLEYHSSRGFLTYTGMYGQVRMSIMSIGMGIAMADFAIREMRAITEGPLQIIRLGTCGTPSASISLGTVIAAKKSYAITTNYDAHIEESALSKFLFSMPVAADQHMHEALMKQLKSNIKEPYTATEGTDATADSFYSTQGRIDPRFNDGNETLLTSIMQLHPCTASLQMETFQLYHLARIGRDIRAAAAAIVVAARHHNSFLGKEELSVIELSAGEACLKALAES